MATVHYENRFDPTHYLKDWYTENPLDIDISIKLLYKLYNSEKFKGGSLLDVCCGPVPHWVAAASRKYTDITFSDLLDRNLEQIRKWLHKAPDAFDWTNAFRYAADAEGVSDHTIIEERVRTAVKDVIPCDIHQENPLLNVTKQFDAIQCSYGLDGASLDQQTLQNTVKNISNILKPGGAFVVLSTLGAVFYYVGPEKLPCLPMTKEMLVDALTGAGFEDIEIVGTFGSKNVDEHLCDLTGSFLCRAFKKF
jgi:ubiquinone/menaquinone biosynthesis C-methylase UbiE